MGSSVVTAAFQGPAVANPSAPAAYQTMSSKPTPDTLQQMIVALRDSIYPSQRELAAQSMASTDWRAHPEVVQALATAGKEDPAATVRAGCVRCLANMRANTPAAVAVVRGLKNDGDPRVRQVMASLSGLWQAVQIIRADGSRVADIRPLVRLSVAVVVGVLDHLTKWWVSQALVVGQESPAHAQVSIHHTENAGAAFGLFPQFTQLYLVVAIAVAVVDQDGSRYEAHQLHGGGIYEARLPAQPGDYRVQVTYPDSTGGTSPVTVDTFNYTPLAVLGLMAGWARWLELRMSPPDDALPGRLWAWAFSLVGVFLIFYRES